ncbi:MAG TPA: hypothetical protein VK116_00560 [Planctomycetota bacterium]|nr:hypothetical protein [Planctomycetota bacterium]
MTSTTLLVLIALAVAGILLYRILGPAEAWEGAWDEGTLSSLKRRRDRILRALKDIEQEREAGLLTGDEFERLRSELRREGAFALRDLERLRAVRRSWLRRPGGAITPSVRRRIDELALARRKEIVS